MSKKKDWASVVKMKRIQVFGYSQEVFFFLVYCLEFLALRFRDLRAVHVETLDRVGGSQRSDGSVQISRRRTVDVRLAASSHRLHVAHFVDSFRRGEQV